MDAYTGFAYVYDEMMADIPYDEWAQYTKKLLEYDDIKPGAHLAELGCGTGSFTMEMCKLGYKMTGIDISTDMLSVAKNKFEDGEYSDTVFSEQSMADFELPEKADACVSICDSVNYLMEDKDIEGLFKSVDKNLKSNGIFIMDLKTRYFYESVLAYNTMAANFENCSYIWDNYYHDDESVNEYLLTIFTKEGDKYRKFEETHFQKAYDLDKIENIARKFGFTNIKIYDAFTMDKPVKCSERVYFVFRR